MADRIVVYTWLPAGRKYYRAEWVDPLTGKNRTESTKQTTKREADKVAGKIEEKLNYGRQGAGRITWQELREEYEQNVFPSLKPTTIRKVKTTFEAVEGILKLKNVSELLPADLLRFQREIRARDVSEWTVKGHLSVLGRIFRWAKKQRLLDNILDFPSPKARHAKGRAPTGEEYDRMRSVTESVVGPAAAESWNYTSIPLLKTQQPDTFPDTAPAPRQPRGAFLLPSHIRAKSCAKCPMRSPVV